jgi:hypothetical protein
VPRRKISFERFSVASDQSSDSEFERIEVLLLRETALQIDLNFIVRNPFSSHE